MNIKNSGGSDGYVVSTYVVTEIVRNVMDQKGSSVRGVGEQKEQRQLRWIRNV